MTKAKNTTAANIAAGSAERIIEDRAGSQGAIEVSTALVQPTPSDDARAVARIFSAMSDLATFETEYRDEHGELIVVNQRGFALKMLARGVCAQLDYVITKQNERCQQAEQSLARAKNDQRGDVDTSTVAQRENWVERETDKLLELINMREAAGLEYEALIGEGFVDYRSRPKAPVSAAAKRRQEAMNRLRG